MNHVFLLGTERSGSTWLANIFDAHPEVSLLMEPFAPYAALFPGFPERFFHIGRHGEELISLVRGGYQNLNKWKYPLAYYPGKNLYWQTVDKYFFAGSSLMARILGLRPSMKFERYELLNLNRKNIPLSRQTRKSPEPSWWVTKELRLNFMSRLILQAFESAKIVITIRHPGAQISSILRIFRQGGLSELQASLPMFRSCLLMNKRFETYGDLLESHEILKDETFVLAAWWLLNYDVLIEDLMAQEEEFYFVSHEKLSQSPVDTSQAVFEFCGMPWADAVSGYVEWSSHSKPTSRSRVDTRRVSEVYSRETIRQAEPEVLRAFRKIHDLVEEKKGVTPILRVYLQEIGLV